MSLYMEQAMSCFPESAGKRLPIAIIEIIVAYCSDWRLREWIKREDLDHICIFANPRAFDLGWVDTHPSWKIHRTRFSLNTHPRVIEMFNENPDIISWDTIGENPGAIDIIMNNMHRIDARRLCSNPHPRAVEWIKAHRDEINIVWLSANPNPDAIALYLELVDGDPQQHFCGFISYNSSEWARDYLAQNPEIIDWNNLTCNPSKWAIEMIRCNKSRSREMVFSQIAANPEIFVLGDNTDARNALLAICWD